MGGGKPARRAADQPIEMQVSEWQGHRATVGDAARGGARRERIVRVVLVPREKWAFEES